MFLKKEVKKKKSRTIFKKQQKTTLKKININVTGLMHSGTLKHKNYYYYCCCYYYYYYYYVVVVVIVVVTVSFQPVLHDWCNKGCGMCYPVCGMVHIKEPLLLIDKSSLCGGSGFPLSLSEWSFTLCLTPYNRK